MRALLKVLLGLTLGLVIAEGAFWLRDGGAFPHVNFYRPDAELGARLEPNDGMKLSVGKNPITTIHTNSLGYRAPEWGAPSEGEVLTVGDSQVFGLGVEDDQTFSAKLGPLLGKPVINGGVPTYGPREYVAVIKEQLAARKLGTVVLVLNLANDLFEVDRPNTDRHRIWDGWAVRAEKAPRDVTNFPLRRWFYSRSHLVFAIRKFLAGADERLRADTESGDAITTVSEEGDWHDVVREAKGVKPVMAVDEAAIQRMRRRSELNVELDQLARKLQRHVVDQIGLRAEAREDYRPLLGGNGDLRDIVSSRYAEMARPIDETAYHLFIAALFAEKNDALVQKIAERTHDDELKDLLTKRRDLRAQIDATRVEGEAPSALPIEDVIDDAKRACDAKGVRLAIVVLPLDVMISAEEWKKYDEKPIDMTPTVVLVDDLLERIRRHDVTAIDPREALLAAEPGAFLHGDLHMTAKGHEALAKTIATALQQPLVVRENHLVLPPGRSWPPSEDEWRRVTECNVKGSTAARCDTRFVREWFRAYCQHDYGGALEEPNVVMGGAVLEGGHGDVAMWWERGFVLQLPVLPGEVAKAVVQWSDDQRVLILDRRDGGTDFHFEKPTPLDAKLQLAVVPSDTRRREVDPLRPPNCEPGSMVAGATLQCAPRCDAQHACDAGHCEPWIGGSFCAVP